MNAANPLDVISVRSSSIQQDEQIVVLDSDQFDQDKEADNNDDEAQSEDRKQDEEAIIGQEEIDDVGAEFGE